MNRPFRFALLLALAGSLASPALAERDRDRDHERHRHHHHHDDHRKDRRDARRHAQPHCPPGLVWHRGECLRKERVQRLTRHRPGIGDRFNAARYQRISDPRRYALPPGQNWNYYHDDNQIYRVDSKTQKVVAVLQLIQALSN